MAASLSLYVISVDRSSPDQVITVYPISQDWNEQGSVPSTLIYGSAITNVMFSTLSSNAWINLDLSSSAVQTWLTNPSANYGVLIKTAKDDPSDGKALGIYPFRLRAFFLSKEDSTITLRPKLTIVYTPPSSSNVRPLVGITW